MKKMAASLLFAACVASAVSAQEFRYGAQATFALPVGDVGSKDFLNHRPGLGLGLHGLWNFYPRHALMPRIDITLYRMDNDGNGFPIPYKEAITMKDIKVGVDYNIAFSNPNIYGIAGLGFSSFEWADPTVPGLARENIGTLYFSLGVGYTMLEHFLAELRYTHASYSGVGSSSGFKGMTLTAPAVSLSLLWRY
ncbi:MAG: outer membrane beta-barrel protein [Holophagales bacterium]|jgi:hypothetical protein|nr:outer membrane beta-barrel protein [Holophagales bacterium]